MRDLRQFVTFDCEGRLHGLDIRVTKEINPTVAITPVPGATDAIRGLVNVRGQVVLVLDIAVIFGRGPRPLTEDSQIVILKTTRELEGVPGLEATSALHAFGDKPLAFLVDRVGDVVTVPATAIEPTPPHLAEVRAHHLAGVVDLGGQVMSILDAGAMLESLNERSVTP